MQRAIIFIALLGFGSYGLAQNDPQYIIVDKDVKKQKEHRVVDNSFVIKFTPTQLLAGEINFGAEFKTGERSSVEVEAGPTITQIGAGRFTTGYQDYFGAYPSSGVGVFTSAAFRYYPADLYPSLNRFYISPKVRYRCYNTMYNFSGDTGTKRGAENQVGFIFNAGLQTWLSDQFAIDYFVGLGIGYSVSTSYQPNYGPMDSQVINKYVYRQTNYIFNIGVKVGIGN